MERKLYCNHADIFLDLSTNLKRNLVEIQKTYDAIKEAPQWRVNDFFGNNPKY